MIFIQRHFYILTFILIIIVWIIKIPIEIKSCITIVLSLTGIVYGKKSYRIYKKKHTTGTAFCYAAAIISILMSGGLIVNYFAVKNFYKSSIGFNLPKDSVILESYDTHGGFHGDGEFYAVVQLNKMQLKQVEADIVNNKAWSRMPLSKYLSEGSSWFTEEKHIDKKRKYEMPVNTENGYYYFQDRHNEPDKWKMPFWDRGSFNFTIAILDTDTGRLYVYLMDT